MAGALGDEGAEVQAHVLAHEVGLLVGALLRIAPVLHVGAVEGCDARRALGLGGGEIAGEFFAQTRGVEVHAPVLELGEPGEVVDAGALPIHLVVGHVGILREQVAGALHAVAEADDGHGRHAAGRGAHHGHGVGVVEHDGLRTQALAVAQHGEKHRDGAQRLEETARTDGVADALVDAVFERDVVVVAHALETADLDAVHDVVGALQHLGAVRRGDDLPLRLLAQLCHQLGDELTHGAQAREIDVHQRDDAPLVARNPQHVVDQTRGETRAGAQHGELDRALHGAGQALRGGVLGVRGVTGEFTGGFGGGSGGHGGFIGVRPLSGMI